MVTILTQRMQIDSTNCHRALQSPACQSPSCSQMTVGLPVFRSHLADKDVPTECSIAFRLRKAALEAPRGEPPGWARIKEKPRPQDLDAA